MTRVRAGTIWIINNSQVPSGQKFAPPSASRIYVAVKLPQKVPIPNPFGWTVVEMLPSYLILEGDEKGKRECLLRHNRPLCIYRYTLSREMYAIYISDMQYKTRKLRTRLFRERENRAFPLEYYLTSSFNIGACIMHTVELHEMVDGSSLSSILDFCVHFSLYIILKKNVNGKLLRL